MQPLLSDRTSAIASIYESSHAIASTGAEECPLFSVASTGVVHGSMRALVILGSFDQWMMRSADRQAAA